VVVAGTTRHGDELQASLKRWRCGLAVTRQSMADDGDARVSVLNGLSVAGLTNDSTRAGRTTVAAAVQSLAATAAPRNDNEDRFE